MVKHWSGTSASTWSASNGEGEWRARGVQLAQHRGSTTGAAWSARNGDGDATASEAFPPAPDLAGRPGSSRRGAEDSMVARFVEMGFPAEKVAMALEHGGGGPDEEEAVLEWLIAHQEADADLEGFSSSSEDVDLADFAIDDEAFGEELSERDMKFLNLVEMGFTEDEASSAIDICGQHETVSVLADAIYAAQIAKRGGTADVELSADEARGFGTSRCVKRKKIFDPSSEKRLHHNKQLGQVDMAFGSGPMVGFGLPNESMRICNRKLSEIAKGLPYFYFENVALAPRGVWDKMSRFLYGIEPEFVDSIYFCAARRKRGYIHNLPIHGRFPILPMQPRTIHEAFPKTRKWWPLWDTRTHLNCIQTVMAPATSSKMVRSVLTDCDGTPTGAERKKILDECKKWNLIWVGPKSVAALEPHEVESVLGFPEEHTRSFAKTERYRSLGNSFQVDTVAFHLSVLKELFPAGIRVLSLFTGIGGAEVALDRLGIRLNVVVSAEISQVNQAILRNWWEQSEQTGELIEIGDVQMVTNDFLETLVRRVGGFDLVVGGSPCNNISGGNRYNRVGLEGEQSSLFYHYYRILEQVRHIMRRM